jgi:hypothetical protein
VLAQLAVWAVVHSSSRSVRAYLRGAYTSCTILFAPSLLFATLFLMHVQFGPQTYYVYRFGLEGKNVVCAVTTSLIMTALR